MEYSRPSGFIFDLDGTLIDSELAYAEALYFVGIDPHSPAYRQARSTVKSRLGSGHVCSHNRLLYFKELLENTQSFEPLKLMELIEAYEGQLQHLIREQWKALDRTRLFDELANRSSLAILTNENTRTQMIKINAIDPNGRYFRHIVTSEEIGCEKPNLKMLEAILKRMELQPSECCMIGDSLEADIFPAIKVGMQAIFTTEFSNGATPTLPQGIRAIAKLDDLLKN